jgi:hypothetical protein
MKFYWSQLATPGGFLCFLIVLTPRIAYDKLGPPRWSTGSRNEPDNLFSIPGVDLSAGLKKIAVCVEPTK